jgi:secreted Zn-dependent insulinase-like peptidase
MSTTTYKCEVLAEHAEGAIDIFANFFVSPLFTRSGTGREVNAVDSENSKNITNDSRRRLQILKALADPTHHYSKFSTGDAKTLPANGMEKVDLESQECASPDRAAGTSKAKDLESYRCTSPGRAAGKSKTEKLESKGCASPDRAAGKPKAELLENKGELVRDALLAFHKRYYRPNNMTVAIVGPQDLDLLQELIVPRFAGIKDQWEQKVQGQMTEAERIVDFASKDAPEVSFGSPSIHNPAFRPELQGGQWPILLTTLPLQSMRKLYLYFPLPPTIHLEDKSPHQLVSHLLGHEGQGSVFAILQDENLADSLSAGPRLSERDQSMLQISVSLTKKGEAQWEKVVKIIFEYCRLLETTINSAQENSDCTGSKDARQELRDIWTDKSKLASLRFHQTSPGPAFGFAPALASSAMKFGSEKCLSSGSLLDETEESLDLNILPDFVGLLTPSNCILERCSQAAWDEQISNTESHNEFDPIFGLKTEPWYGVQYYLSKVQPPTVSEWSKSIDFADRIHLPEQNRYIPRNLELCADLPPEAKLGPRIGKKLDPPNLTIEEEYGKVFIYFFDQYIIDTHISRTPIRSSLAQIG